MKAKATSQAVPTDIEEIRKVLAYDPLTGEFRRVKRCRGVRLGRTAGHCRKGDYLRLQVLNKFYLGHRLAWAVFYGTWPDGQIDHRDGDKQNNRIKNLRDVSRSANQQNMRKASTRSTTGYLGVSKGRREGTWYSAIRAQGVSQYLGMFDSPEKAHAAYVAAKRRLHEGCTI